MADRMCAMCFQVKDESDFRLKSEKGGKPYRDSYCSNCYRSYNREYRRFYYEKHKEEICRKNVEYNRRVREKKRGGNNEIDEEFIQKIKCQNYKECDELLKDYNREIYNKVIDDFAEKLEKRFFGMEMSSGLSMEGVTWGNARKQLKQMTEQLSRIIELLQNMKQLKGELNE